MPLTAMPSMEGRIIGGGDKRHILKIWTLALALISRLKDVI